MAPAIRNGCGPDWGFPRIAVVKTKAVRPSATALLARVVSSRSGCDCTMPKSFDPNLLIIREVIVENLRHLLLRGRWQYAVEPQIHGGFSIVVGPVAGDSQRESGAREWLRAHAGDRFS